MKFHLLNNQLLALRKLLEKLDYSTYTKKSKMLGEIALGQHVRHIIELAQCMVQGYEASLINYDARKRDPRLETSTEFAITQLVELINAVNLPDKALLLMQDGHLIQTFYYREVMYNTEHAIHHMALIRVALREMQMDIVDENFGVAPSTLQYRKSAYA